MNDDSHPEPSGSAPESPDSGTAPSPPSPYIQVNQPAQVVQARATNPIGTAAGVLGIVGAVLFWFPGVNFILAILSFIFGIIGTSKGRKQDLPIGMAVTGIVLGGLGLLVTIVFSIVMFGGFAATGSA